VQETLAGAAVDPGSREAAADAMRSVGKSALLISGAAVCHASCIGPVLMLVAGIGVAQRLLGLWTARKLLAEDASSDHGRAADRALLAAIAEAAAWLPAAFLALGAASMLPGGLGGAAEELFVDLWFGAAVLSAIACWTFVDASIARFALDLERRRLPAILALATVPPLLVAALLRALPNPPSGIGGACTVLGALLWAAASVLLAHQGSSAGDELAGGPRRRVIRTPEDAPIDARGPVAARRPRPADDDAPIPLD
jgi:hypothetical protein